VALLAVLGMVGPATAPLFGQVRDSIPSATYHAAFYDFYEGEFDKALDGFQDAWRGSIKSPQGHWIDSICYHAMMGECYYQMGDLGNALDQYTAAVRLYLTFPDWMIAVQFPQAIRPAAGAPAPWGVSTRGAQLGQYPSSMPIQQGRVNNNEAIQRGGVVQQAMLIPIGVQEIVRATTLAIRRRTELLGPLSKHDPLSSELINELSRRPGPPNHWSQAWIDVQLGLALIAGGKENEAVAALNQGIVAAGQFDHPLTSTALLALGQLALARGDYAAATQFFHEASIAAYQYFDGTTDGIVAEEALRLSTVAHLAANQKGIFASLVPAIQWAKKDLRWVQASLMLSLAENMTVSGQTADAASTLNDVNLGIGRRWMRNGRLGARLNYLRATVSFQQRRIAEGDAALMAAATYLRRGSLWLYQIARLEYLFAGGQITPRKAMELYEELLRDPQAADWTLQPMESFAVLVSPHSEAVEHWFLAALSRGNHEAALEIADRVRRHRFFSSLTFGGRLQSLRWILEAPDEALDRAALLNRQDLLAGYPAYAALSQEARRVRQTLLDMPLASEDAEASSRQRRGLEQLRQISLQQEAVLREMAVRRQNVELVFPPLRSTQEIQAALPEGQVMLAFLESGGDLYGFLLNKEKYGYWKIPRTSTLTRRMTAMLREMGHYDPNRELTLKELADKAWKESARGVLDQLLEGAQADFSGGFQELVIVPDGVLWYLPFEALQVMVGDQSRPLIDRFRIRYAPTASLGVPGADRRRRSPTAKTAVVVGRLYPRDGPEVAQAAFTDLARVVGRTTPLSKPPLPACSSVYGSLMDQLIVLDDVVPAEQGPYSWAPIQIERAKPGNMLSDWLSLPWGGPDVILLPGFHTAAESGLKGINRAAPGSEVFLSVCGLMAGGARTILIARWRSGGQSSVDLVREFAQELPQTSPSEAYKQAVLAVASKALVFQAEPRVKAAANAEPLRGNHPFFWAGMMLVDSGEPARVEAEAKKPDAAEAQKMEPDGKEAKQAEPKEMDAGAAGLKEREPDAEKAGKEAPPEAAPKSADDPGNPQESG
jgi:CHAT domain-containing protein/tetratricopeptide (TPR) repeat protein